MNACDDEAKSAPGPHAEGSPHPPTGSWVTRSRSSGRSLAPARGLSPPQRAPAWRSSGRECAGVDRRDRAPATGFPATGGSAARRRARSPGWLALRKFAPRDPAAALDRNRKFHRVLATVRRHLAVRWELTVDHDSTSPMPRRFARTTSRQRLAPRHRSRRGRRAAACAARRSSSMRATGRAPERGQIRRSRRGSFAARASECGGGIPDNRGRGNP